jgi:hypothetical protein
MKMNEKKITLSVEMVLGSQRVGKRLFAFPSDALCDQNIFLSSL